MLGRKFIALNTYTRKEERSQISNLSIHNKEIRKRRVNQVHSKKVNKDRRKDQWTRIQKNNNERKMNETQS